MGWWPRCRVSTEELYSLGKPDACRVEAFGLRDWAVNVCGAAGSVSVNSAYLLGDRATDTMGW